MEDLYKKSFLNIRIYVYVYMYEYILIILFIVGTGFI